MSNKMGRPPLPKKKFRGAIFGVRLRVDEARRVRDAIRKSGQSQPDWLRKALLNAADRE